MTDPMALLTSIRLLRFYEKEELFFWEEFFTKVAQLTKAKSGFIFHMKDQENEVIPNKYIDALDTTTKDEILKSSFTLSKRALSNGFAYERLDLSSNNFGQSVLLTIHLPNENENDNYFLSLILEKGNSQQFNETIIRTQLINDIPLCYFANKKTIPNQAIALSTDNSNPPQLQSVLELLNDILKIDNFKLALMTLANNIASKYSCSQVSIGWVEKEYVKTIAISHLEDFKRNTETVSSLESVFEESFDQNVEISIPDTEESTDLLTIKRNHERYLKKHLLDQVVSFPLRKDKKILGVITFQNIENSLSEDDLYSLRLLTNEIMPWIEHLYIKDLPIHKKIKRKTKNNLKWWLGSNNTILKLFSITASLLIMYMMFGSWNYKVEATATLNTNNVSYLSTPYDSFVDKVTVNSGDIVKKDQTLLVLNTEELLLKEAETHADIFKYKAQAEKARAESNLADMKVANAKVTQAKATYKRIQYYLDQAVVKSPIAGIVVEGNKEELMGAPLNKGDIIFKIAQSKDIFVTAKIKEQDIDEIFIGAKGELSLLSNPDHRFAFEVKQIIPLAQVDSSDGNVFLIKGNITSKNLSWWRPGMSGVAKIDVGERNIFWILTHDFVDYMKMYLWW